MDSPRAHIVAKRSRLRIPGLATPAAFVKPQPKPKYARTSKENVFLLRLGLHFVCLIPLSPTSHELAAQIAAAPTGKLTHI